ncbi:hypothetical protein SLS60_001670 [Paraconiothyrium brasiliense]|uniref:Uncharacterized protein n=1 Tax=Paraconiothyrium brasiliense TaxID=300254 RepID=A0ABR3S013_9PLEO
MSNHTIIDVTSDCESQQGTTNLAHDTRAASSIEGNDKQLDEDLYELATGEKEHAAEIHEKDRQLEDVEAENEEIRKPHVKEIKNKGRELKSKDREVRNKDKELVKMVELEKELAVLKV